MKSGHNKRFTFTKKTCVVATQVALAMMASQVTFAQQVAQSTPKAGERIEVTGSRIPMQQNVESTSPVVVLGQEELAVNPWVRRRRAAGRGRWAAKEVRAAVVST